MVRPPITERLGIAFQALRGVQFKSTGGYFEEIMELLTLHRRSKAGVSVNLDTALHVATVRACTRVIAEGLAQIPCRLTRRFDDGRREVARDLPLYRLLYRQPNDWQTAFEFREMLLYHAVLAGNGYAFINRDGANEITELIPLTPNRCTAKQDPDTTVWYQLRSATGQTIRLERDQVFHIRGASWDGVIGMEPVQLAREAIGLAIAAEESQADLHRNGLQTSGILSFEVALGDKARERLKERIKEFKADADDSVLILDQAAKFEKTAMSGVDSQHLETRKHQIEEICRAMRVFPQMVGYSANTTTYASAEQFFMAHVVHTLAPWAERWDQAVARDLIGLAADGPDYELVCKLSMQGLMRGDNASRSAFYASGILNGWMTRNEARDLEDMPLLPGLDAPLQPLNMAPAGQTSADPAMAKAIAQLLIVEFGSFTDLANLEAKVGRVLSAANEHRLRDAKAAIDEVLASLGASAAAA